ncbi:hypothetical protein LCM20_09780 [Halobacillus litoralis]|uniref:hypothetical protein n=1 Tax=Halobacillus litoralis TaxID=45668 RepID=UPI001CD1BA4B|nr:hypothetical protein [Halobacillus litoralis]MCA0970879.1 hypothetical protein [Halobacillus litoralis]
MHTLLKKLAAVLAGWSIYNVSIPIFSFLDQFGGQVGNIVFGLLDFAMKTGSIFVIVFFSFMIVKEAWEERKDEKKKEPVG